VLRMDTLTRVSSLYVSSATFSLNSRSWKFAACSTYRWQGLGCTAFRYGHDHSFRCPTPALAWTASPGRWRPAGLGLVRIRHWSGLGRVSGLREQAANAHVGFDRAVAGACIPRPVDSFLTSAWRPQVRSRPPHRECRHWHIVTHWKQGEMGKVVRACTAESKAGEPSSSFSSCAVMPMIWCPLSSNDVSHCCPVWSCIGKHGRGKPQMEDVPKSRCHGKCAGLGACCRGVFRCRHGKAIALGRGVCSRKHKSQIVTASKCAQMGPHLSGDCQNVAPRRLAGPLAPLAPPAFCGGEPWRMCRYTSNEKQAEYAQNADTAGCVNTWH